MIIPVIVRCMREDLETVKPLLEELGFVYHEGSVEPVAKVLRQDAVWFTGDFEENKLDELSNIHGVIDARDNRLKDVTL